MFGTFVIVLNMVSCVVMWVVSYRLHRARREQLDMAAWYRDRLAQLLREHG